MALVGCSTRYYLSVPQSPKIAELTCKAFEDIQCGTRCAPVPLKPANSRTLLWFRFAIASRDLRWWSSQSRVTILHSLRIPFGLFAHLGRSSLQYLRTADRSRARAPTCHPHQGSRLVPGPGGLKIKRAGRIKMATFLRLTSALHPQSILQRNAFGLSHYSAFPTGMAMVYSTVLRGCIRCFGVSMHLKW